MATIKKEVVIADLQRFAPQIIGVCPKCGHVIFHGYKCFNCYYDSTDDKDIEKHGEPTPFDIDDIE